MIFDEVVEQKHAVFALLPGGAIAIQIGMVSILAELGEPVKNTPADPLNLPCQSTALEPDDG
jgi:hypothetical protein